MKNLTFLLVFLPFLSIAQEFCSRGNSEIQNLLERVDTRIAFKNDGGLFNGGVCWWHSRLQRSSIYLAQYAPLESRPDLNQVRVILKHLRNMDQVVTIPGFEDFESFTRTYQKEVQKMLEDWQRSDGFANSEWRRGISGRSKLPALALSKKMKEIYQLYKDSPVPLWVMAQIKGITAHSFLILEMNEAPKGYRLRIIDSNRPDATRDISYEEGATDLMITGSNYTFVLYPGFQEDFKKMSAALKSYCPKGLTDMTEQMRNVRRGDIELP